MGAVRRFFHRLWNVRHDHYVGGHEPVPVSWPSGSFRIRIKGSRTVALSVWTPDGRVLGMLGRQPLEFDLETELPMGAVAMHVHDDEQHLRIDSLEIDGQNQLVGGQRIALSMLKGSGYSPRFTPRWRIFLRGLREALQWAPVSVGGPRG